MRKGDVALRARAGPCRSHRVLRVLSFAVCGGAAGRHCGAAVRFGWRPDRRTCCAERPACCLGVGLGDTRPFESTQPVLAITNRFSAIAFTNGSCAHSTAPAAEGGRSQSSVLALLAAGDAWAGANGGPAARGCDGPPLWQRRTRAQATFSSIAGHGCCACTARPSGGGIRCLPSPFPCRALCPAPHPFRRARRG